MVNKTILIGNLGNEPEVRFSQNGAAIASFSMATTETFKDAQGNKQEKTEWHRIVAFGRLGEICGEYLQKGSKVYIEGRLQTRKWDDKEGVTRYTTEIVAREMKMLSARSGSSSQGNQNGQSDQVDPQHYPDQSFAMGDDVPF